MSDTWKPNAVCALCVHHRIRKDLSTNFELAYVCTKEPLQGAIHPITGLPCHTRLIPARVEPWGEEPEWRQVTDDPFVLCRDKRSRNSYGRTEGDCPDFEEAPLLKKLRFKIRRSH